MDTAANQQSAFEDLIRFKIYSPTKGNDVPQAFFQDTTLPYHSAL